MIDLFKVAMHPNAGAAAAETLASGYVGEGPKVAEFERRLVPVLRTEREPVTVNSCTAAIDLALHLCGIGPGDEVISTPMTCTATNGPIVNRGARIVWADIDPITGLIAPSDVLRKVTPRTRAVVAVDWGGRSCDFRGLRGALRAASEQPIPIVEDAAHRLSIDPANHGDFAAWSFGPIKHLSCGGYGGALWAEDRHDRERARLLRWHGLDRTSSVDFRCAQTIAEAGYRYHLTDDLATVGLANLALAQANVGKARENARWYDRVLRGVPGIALQPFALDCDYWLYTVLVEDRAGLIAHLAAHGIASSPVHVRNDVHPAYHFPNGSLPGVDAFAARELAIPVGWHLEPKDREAVASAVIEWAVKGQETPRSVPAKVKELVAA